MSQFGSILRFGVLTCVVPVESTEVSTTTDHKLFALFTLDGNHKTDGIVAIYLKHETCKINETFLSRFPNNVNQEKKKCF